VPHQSSNCAFSLNVRICIVCAHLYDTRASCLFDYCHYHWAMLQIVALSKFEEYRLLSCELKKGVAPKLFLIH
jgi:hypothetical protein